MPFLGPLIKATIALIIIVDPVGLIPVFMALTQDFTPRERQSTLSQATLVGLLLLLVFTFSGTLVLRLLGITLEDFEIAGGILLLVLALQIINSAHYSQAAGARPGVVPLAIPLLVGPGAITTSIVLIGLYGLWITVVAVLIAFVASAVIFRFVGILYRLLGETGSDVIAKIMGMLLAAIAIRFIREGIMAVFHV